MKNFITVKAQGSYGSLKTININNIVYFQDNFIQLEDDKVILCREYHSEIARLIEENREQEDVV